MKELFLLPTLVAGLGLLAASTDCLHAATFTVTTTNISGPGSLPVVIAQANATPGKNQINISVTNTITLGLALPTITNSVAIAGVATTPAIISGGGTLPLFSFAARATNSLSNLVLANGYTTNNGAAIVNQGTLSVNACWITNNSATNGFGGAISNAGTMTISKTLIQNNKARNGGAIFSVGSMTINQCVLSQNQAISSSGGGIYNFSNLVIFSTVFSQNVATNNYAGASAWGGGICHKGGMLAISGSVFIT